MVLLVFVMFLGSTMTAAADYPNDWTHRPVLEHFTGLSCPPCMSGAHPDSTQLWQEEGYTEGNPWNYIEFHELNGGGEDDLMTDESEDRMRYYQPGVSGTPSLEADGGYVQLGGSHGSTADANYADMKEALADSGNRDAIKKVKLDVVSKFDGSEFVINVTVEYLQNDEAFDPFNPLAPDTLNGLLHVFMIEDNVTAWSTVNEEYVTTHNVFREYGMEGEEITLEVGETWNKMAVWNVPTTAIRDGEEEEIRVPINPLNVYPVAVLYDTDDTSSGRGDGSDNNDGGDGDGTPRALNSATPMSSAYDADQTPPTIRDITLKKEGKKVNASLYLDDRDDIAGAIILYTTSLGGDNESVPTWMSAEIKLKACVGDVCDKKESGLGYATLDITPGTEFYFYVLAYDGEWTQATSKQMKASDYMKVSSGGSDATPFDPMLPILAFAIVAIMVSRKRRN